MTQNVDQETLGKYLLGFLITGHLVLGRKNRLETDFLKISIARTEQKYKLQKMYLIGNSS